MKKILVLGAMPEGTGPEDCFAAGPWCFADREHLFPGWETRFTFAPEPLRDPVCLKLCAKQALSIYAEVLPALIEKLSPGNKLSRAYWDTLLAPWAVDVARQIAERWARVVAMIDLWGNRQLHVPLLPLQCEFSFTAGHDFTLYGALGTCFNHWLFSRLLESVWPKAWTMETLSPVSERHDHGPASTGLRERLLQSARRLVLRLPCPPLKGMGMLQSLRFSLALLHKSKGEDHSCPPESVFEEIPQKLNMALPTLPIFSAALPEVLRAIKHPKTLDKTGAPRSRIVNILAYEDEIYRQRLAVWRERGHRLIYVQHGSGYGQTLTGTLTPAVEYSQHAFITWGWKRHNNLRCNFIPLPYPQLARIAERHHGRENTLIFVGTEMPLFPYRLDASPTPLQIVDYRQSKARFFADLNSDLRARCLYRPYFPVPGTLEDEDWLLPQFPQLRLCAGHLTDPVLACRLLVLDHPGTTMLEGMAANVPMVLYWSRQSWPMTPESEIMLDVLADAGIWHPTPEAAAAAANRIFDTAPSWWQSQRVQAARSNYCAKYALTDRGAEDKLWIKTLAQL